MLKDILSISGKPGLYKRITNTARAIIVESLQDGKRFPAYTNSKIISLEDVSVYAETEDISLKNIFKRIFEKESGGPTISHKESAAVVTGYIEEIVPEYDRNRVYLSDMKKILQWYNTLLEKGLLHFEEEQPDAGESEIKEAEA
ncbi:MAG: DUF5606 domain-containing protein [Odoribacteraceae bacterium]|jgi:hypothetical protein|nr:DUF5606 domain-containing protein [Odoribacteraceae bacterium]